MASQFAGTWRMLRLALRRDRWLLPAWVVGLAGMAGFSASATVDLYPTEQSRLAAAEALNTSGAIIALYGRVYDPTSLGELSMIKLTAFGASIIGIVTLFLAIRHTRAEEESGRLELLSGGRVGRLAPLTAAVLLVAGTVACLGLLTSVANSAAGLPVLGSIAFGAGWAMTGLVFGCVGVAVAQVTTSARGARVLGLSILGVTYALRAVGDLAEPGPSALSWLSPIGWNQQVRAYAGDRWWVLALPATASGLLLVTAYAMRTHRDLGSGLVTPRVARSHRLATLGQLAWRLQAGGLIAWSVGFIAFALLLGSLSESVQNLLASSTMRDYLSRLSDQDILIDAFLGAEIAIMGAIASAFGISAMLRLRSEEADGHAEALLATRATRLRWAASHAVVAFVGVALLMALTGVGLGVSASTSLGDWSMLPRILAACLAQVPAAWVVASLAMLAFGWVPRLAAAGCWALLVAFIVIGEFGALWQLPTAVMDLSPLRHAPSLPVTWADLPAIGWLLAATIGLGAIGSLGWSRRDLVS